MQDVAFGKNNAKSEASQLRDSIRIVDEKMQMVIEQRIKMERDYETQIESIKFSHKQEIDQRQVQLDKLANDLKETSAQNVLKDTQIKELNEKILLLEQESNNFAIEFQRWENTFEKDQKLKEVQIEKLQGELDLLNETLSEKEHELAQLKIQKQYERVV